MEFFKWIDRFGGPSEVARQLNVTPHAVRAWMRKEYTPNYKIMKRIVELSNRKVGFEEILRETN